MLRPKSVVSQRCVTTIVAPLALVLSMSTSDQALAACQLSATAGTVVECSGDSELPEGTITGVSITDGAASPQIGVRLLTDGTALDNSVDISSAVTDPSGRNAFAVFGIYTPGINGSEWSISNSGNVSATHNGIGQLAAIGFIGNNEELYVENSGTLSITRGAITLGNNNASSLTASTAGGSGSLGNAAAIWVQEEENQALFIENSGTISASGKLTAGIFSRGAFLAVENEEDGVIQASGAGSVAIEAHNGTDQEDEDGVHKYYIGNTVIENEGKIIGDTVSEGAAAIQIVDANGLRYMASRLSEGAGAGYDPIAITSQAGRRDSTIINSGEIKGDIYLGAGNHVFTNTAEGEVEGNIDVDQRGNFNYNVSNPGSLPLQVFRAGEGGADDDDDDDDGASAIAFSSVADFLAAYPDHHFEFDNAAEFEGDVTVHTNVTGPTASTIVLRPHITGSGAGSSQDAPSDESGYIDGTLAIGIDGNVANGRDVTVSTIATTTKLTPVIDSVVHDGEWFLVARTLFGSDLPEVEEESVLVDWEAAKNAGGSLVVGATVHDASIISGLSAPGVATINALMATDGSNDAVNGLATAMQNLTDEEDVRVAGEQLAPETNFATQQAALTLNMMTGNYIDNRLVGVGATAPSAASFASPSGLGMSKSASAAPAGRMSLGLGTDDGRMNIGANDGRMDAGIYDEQVDLRQRGYASALWGQVFGAGLDQSERSNVDGYMTHIYGAMAGADNWISSDTRLGFAAGYGNTSIEGSGDTRQNETDVDSYLGVVYGAFKGNGWYLSGRAGYAWHDYSTKRVVTVPFSDTATASHSGNQYSASAEIGVPLYQAGATLTPVASLSWSQLDQDGYTEASGNGVGLSISSQTTTSLASGLGAKALIPIAADTLIEGRAIWYHEFEDTNQQVTAAFADGASFLASGPSVGRDTAAVGVGLFAYSTSAVSFQLNYDALFREDFFGHTGSGRVKVEF